MFRNAILLIVGFTAGAAVAVAVLYMAMRFSDGGITIDGAQADALEIVAGPYLAGFKSGSVVYVDSSSGSLLLGKLKAQYPKLDLRAYRERPPDDGCKSLDDERPTAPCERNDYLRLEVLSALTQSAFLVGFSTYASGGAGDFDQVLGPLASDT